MTAMQLLVATLLVAGASAAEVRANPIRKVVTMLQDMQKTVEEEGKKEEDVFDKFMCYCSNGEGALQASIDVGNAQIEQLGAAVERGTAEFAASSGDAKSNLQAMGGALEALKKGLS